MSRAYDVLHRPLKEARERREPMPRHCLNCRKDYDLLVQESLCPHRPVSVASSTDLVER